MNSPLGYVSLHQMQIKISNNDEISKSISLKGFMLIWWFFSPKISTNLKKFHPFPFKECWSAKRSLKLMLTLTERKRFPMHLFLKNEVIFRSRAYRVFASPNIDWIAMLSWGSSIYKELAYHYYNGAFKSRFNIDKVSKSHFLRLQFLLHSTTWGKKPQEYHTCYIWQHDHEKMLLF